MRLLPVIITCGVENVNEGDLESVKQKTSNYLFMELFAISAFCVLFLALLSLIGVFGIIFAASFRNVYFVCRRFKKRQRLPRRRSSARTGNRSHHR